MSAKQRPIAMVKSDPCPPSYVREAKSPGLVLPIRQMGTIHRDSMLLYSVSEPNLTLSSQSQVCDRDARSKISHTDEQLHTSGPVSTLLSPNGRPRFIRFQSHVRITSGISRPHRKPTVTSHVADIDISLSPRSSPSSSRASSVYAPLRSRSDDENPRSSLGMPHRVRKAAFQKRGRRRSKDNEKIGERCLCEQAGKWGPGHSNERTPLLNRTIQSIFEREGTDYTAGDSHLSHAVDFIFGTWPGRLLNRHWWWWKMEPILCCHYLDESDAEY